VPLQGAASPLFWPTRRGCSRTAPASHCHQTIGTMRFGVRLPQLKAEIVDRIKAAGDIGVTSVEIIADLYRDRRPVHPTTIKAHVDQINDLLISTDWRIASDHRRWFLSRKGGAL
jgi:hypothetical protein